jgi:hypothetical protein
VRCRSHPAQLAGTLLVASAAALLSLTAPASAATAVAPDITIVSVAPQPGQPNQGQMVVTLKSDDPLSAISVTLSDAAGPVLTVSDFIPESGSPNGSTEIWTVESPITASQLAPGTYQASVTPTYGGQTYQPVTGAEFAFLIQPTVTLAANPSSITYHHTSVTFSGHAEGIVPGALSPTAYADQKISIAGPGTSTDPTRQYVATTDENGDYQLTLPAAPPGDYYAYIPASSTTVGAHSDAVPVSAVTSRARMTIKFDRPDIEYGQTDRLTGTLTYTAGGSSLPLAGTKVTVARVAPPGQGKLYAETNGAGKFSVDIPRQTVTGTWTATESGASLLGPAAVTRNLTVRQTTGLTHVSIQLSPWGVEVNACLVDTSPGQSKKELSQPVDVEFARSARGPWRVFAAATPGFGRNNCPGKGLDWTVAVGAPSHNAYYRLRFPGTDNLRVSVSRPVHLWRTATRITNFTISPHKVKVNGAVTVVGRLWRQVSRGHGHYAWVPARSGTTVVIEVDYKGTYYGYRPVLKTNSRGYFSGLFAAKWTATWLAVYNGRRGVFAAASSRIKITVTGGSTRISSTGHDLQRVARPPRTAAS